jgi:hypothetical protein
MMLKNSDYHGFPALTLSNSVISIDFLSTAGPRIIRLLFNDDEENILLETPKDVWQTPNGPYRILGGHRLWHSPEMSAFTYIPDGTGLNVQELPGGVRLTQPVEVQTGIQKTMEIRMSADQPSLRISHILENKGIQPVRTAAWALTMLPVGGRAIMPLETQPVDPEGLQPNRNLVFWPYTKITDSRLHFADEHVEIETRSDGKPLKIGGFKHDGWLGYWRGGILFQKRTNSTPSAEYPDRSCNLEVYTNSTVIELETLGMLINLQPGETTTLIEDWSLRKIDHFPDVSEI